MNEPNLTSALNVARDEPFYTPKMKLEAADRTADSFILEFSVPDNEFDGGWAIVPDDRDADVVFTQEPPVALLAKAKRVWGTVAPITA